VETSAGIQQLLWEPSLLWSGRPGWCRKSPPPFFLAPCLVILNLLHILPHPCRRLLTKSTQKILGLQKLSVSNLVRRPNKRAGMHAHGQVGSATGGLWAATSPWIQQRSPLPDVDCSGNMLVFCNYCAHGAWSEGYCVRSLVDTRTVLHGVLWKHCEMGQSLAYT